MKLRQKSSKLAFTLFMSAGLAAAQTPQTTPTTPEAQAPETGGIPVSRPPGGEPAPGTKPLEEEILVTGSRLRRKDLTTPAPVTVLTRQQWQESGKLTIGDFLQTLPEQGNAPNFQLNNGGATYSADGSTRLSLRSLGVTRTLVLVNGRRMVNAGLGASSSVDLNSIPTAVVERIEVLKDGASAVYGSDAIAGVVNIITRRRFNGTEIGAEYGISTRGDARTVDVQGVMGRSGDWGNFLLAAGYFSQGESWLRDRDFSKFALTYDYTTQMAIPGGSSRTPAGVIQLPQQRDGSPDPNCTAGTLCRQFVTLYPNSWFKRFVRDPNGDPNLPGVNLGWRPFTGADRYNFASANYLTIPSERIQAYASGDTKVGFARPYFESFFVQRHTQQNAAPMPLNPGDYTFPGTNRAIFVSKDNFYNPFGVDLAFAGRRLVEFGNRTYTQDLDTFRIVAGVDGTLPDSAGPLRGWFWDASVNYGRTSGTFTTNGAIRNSRIADAVGPSFVDATGQPQCGTPAAPVAGCVPLNLFGGPNNGSINPRQIGFLGFTGTSRAFDQLFTVDANVGGELVRIAADRPTAIVVGYEYRRQLGAQIADPIVASGDSADFNFSSTSGRFSSNEAYAELSIPIISGAPFIQNLEASAAGRYVNYSTFGSKFTYKFGARYTPIPDFTLRGTYSTAFRAPGISELFLGNAETAPTVRDPCAVLTPGTELQAQCTRTGVPARGSQDTGNQELAHVGGNPNLKAETAKIFTAGIVVEPQVVRNLSITVDYYHTTVDDPVGTVGLATILKGCYPGAGGTPFDQYCNQIHRDTNGGIQFVEDFNTNLNQIRTAGVDFALRYFLPTPVGRFGYAFDGTWLAFFDRDQAHAPTIHGKGNYDLGALPAIKFNTGVTYYFVGFNAAVLGRFVGSFKECGAFDTDSGDYLSAGGLCWLDPTARRQVGSNFVVDVNVGYNFNTPIGNTYVSAGMNNVFDKAPQFVYAAPLANSDPSVYDYIGRFVYFRVLQRF